VVLDVFPDVMAYGILILPKGMKENEKRPVVVCQHGLEGRPQHVIGKTTVGAMQSGIFWGYIGLIEGLVTRIEAEWKRKMTVIGTGGLVPLVADGTPCIQHVDPDLTLKGLVEIYKLNRP